MAEKEIDISILVTRDTMSSPSSPGCVFVIVGKKDPVYEAEFRAPSGAASAAGGAGPTSSAFLSQFVVYSSLDMVESALWVNRY